MLDKVNLNLLRTLQVLLRECHVSKTAEQLHITQSAVSRQLTQLRELFQDPLLVRDGNKLLPTPRALALQKKLDLLLAEFADLVMPVEFSPEQWQGQIVLASSDYVAQFILPEVIAMLAKQAPQLKVDYQLWLPQQLSSLSELDIQLVSTMLPVVPKELSGEHIGADYPVCVMRKDHPLADKPELTLDDFLAYGHISVSGGGDKDSFVEHYLDENQQSRNIQCRVPFFTSALNSVCKTDMLLVIPDHIAFNMSQLFPIHYCPLPMPVPEHKYWLMWHPKYDSDPAHQWIREQVLSIMRSSMYSVAMT